MMLRRYYGVGLALYGGSIAFQGYCCSAFPTPPVAISSNGQTTNRTPILLTAAQAPLNSSGNGNNGDDGDEERSTNTALLHSRRSFGIATARAFLLAGVQAPLLLTGMLPAQAANKPTQEEIDKAKLYKGYERLNYLLDNWQKETTVCGKGDDNPYVTGGRCERTPIKVMEFLGYKDTTDPLFKAEKTMRRLESLVPSDREVEFLEAVEMYVEASDEGSGMAYVSSWGEANPGGGKDRVEIFIERAKKNVIVSRDSLATIIDILEIAKP